MCSAFQTGGREEGEPEVVAGGGERPQDQQRRDAEGDEGKAAELPEARVGGEQRLPGRDRAEGEVPAEHMGGVGGRDRRGHHPEVAAVVEQRQEATVEPGERADRERERQQHEGAAAPGLDRERLGVERGPGGAGGRAEHQIAVEIEERRPPARRRRRSACCGSSRPAGSARSLRDVHVRQADGGGIDRSGPAQREAPQSGWPAAAARARARRSRGPRGGAPHHRIRPRRRTASSLPQRSATSGQSRTRPGTSSARNT